MITKLDQFLNELNYKTYSSAADKLHKMGHHQRALDLHLYSGTVDYRHLGSFNIEK